MSKLAAIRIALLALVLAVSHIALISHVTAHFEPALEQCELCVAQAELLSAVPAPDHEITADAGFGLANFENRQSLLPARRCLTFHQRAPPTLSA
jgi:hypothetical protein